MKVLLIQPSRLEADGRVYKNKSRWLLGMTLPYLAALTPPGIDVAIKDDLYEDVDFNEPCDVVGLTCMSHQAIAGVPDRRRVPRAGQADRDGGVSRHARPRRGAPTCRRGRHRRGRRGLAARIEDAAAGRLQRRYQSSTLSDLEGLPSPRYDLIDLRRYRIPNLPAQTTRGCPYACSYCEVTQVYGAKFRYRPPEEVVEEVKTLMRLGKRRFVYFVDDIFNAHRKHAFAVMEGLNNAQGQLDLPLHGERRRGHRDARLDARSGVPCISISAWSRSTRRACTRSTRSRTTPTATRNSSPIFARHGIEFSLNVMFGLDGDTTATFDATVDKLIEYKAPVSFMFILSPRVGLKIRDELLAQGRIDHSEWDRYHSYEMRLQAAEHDPFRSSKRVSGEPSAGSTRTVRSPGGCFRRRTVTRCSRCR